MNNFSQVIGYDCTVYSPPPPPTDFTIQEWSSFHSLIQSMECISGTTKRTRTNPLDMSTQPYNPLVEFISRQKLLAQTTVHAVRRHKHNHDHIATAVHARAPKKPANALVADRWLFPTHLRPPLAPARPAGPDPPPPPPPRARLSTNLPIHLPTQTH